MADLTDCDREPIHIPGTVQPHGVLLVLAEPALSVTQVSDNVRQHLSLDVGDILGRPLDAVIDFFDGTELVPPGVVPAGAWRGETNAMRVVNYAGIGRKAR